MLPRFGAIVRRRLDGPILALLRPRECGGIIQPKIFAHLRGADENQRDSFKQFAEDVSSVVRGRPRSDGVSYRYRSIPCGRGPPSFSSKSDRLLRDREPT